MISNLIVFCYNLLSLNLLVILFHHSFIFLDYLFDYHYHYHLNYLIDLNCVNILIKSMNYVLNYFHFDLFHQDD